MNPMPARAAAPASCRQLVVVGLLGQTDANGERGATENAEQLADHQSGDDRERSAGHARRPPKARWRHRRWPARTAAARRSSPTARPSAAACRPETRCGRGSHRAPAVPAPTARAQDASPRRLHLGADDRLGLRHQRPQVGRRPGRRGERDDHAGQRRMQARARAGRPTARRPQTRRAEDGRCRRGSTGPDRR